jgi:hypothetical protein
LPTRRLPSLAIFFARRVVWQALDPGHEAVVIDQDLASVEIGPFSLAAGS